MNIRCTSLSIKLLRGCILTNTKSNTAFKELAPEVLYYPLNLSNQFLINFPLKQPFKIRYPVFVILHKKFSQQEML